VAKLPDAVASDLENAAEALGRFLAGIREAEHPQPVPAGETPFAWRLGCALTGVSVRLLSAELDLAELRGARSGLRLTPPQRDALCREIRFHSRYSDDLYADRDGFAKSGADPVDGERHRLVAEALRRVHGGSPVAEAIAWFWCEWRRFVGLQSAKVAEAPKIRHGYMDGCSAMHHVAATESMGHRGELDIARACEAAVWECPAGEG
jgi:hypothetical protein